MRQLPTVFITVVVSTLALVSVNSFSTSSILPKTSSTQLFSSSSDVDEQKEQKKVVVIGGYEEEQFVADEILTKCASKYEETDITAGENTSL